jgi:hypothetical protein
MPQYIPEDDLTSSCSPFELNFRLKCKLNEYIPDLQNLPNIKHFKCLFQNTILVNNDSTSVFNFNNWMFLFMIVHKIIIIIVGEILLYTGGEIPFFLLESLVESCGSLIYQHLIFLWRETCLI